MLTFLKPLFVRKTLLEKKMAIFTMSEFSRLFPVSGQKIKYFLERQAKEGLFLRLKNGLYMLKTDPVFEEEIANRLYQPSYLSFEYALAYHHLLPEMPYSLTSATTKPTRIFEIENKTFSYLTIKKEAFTGYSLIKTPSREILMADPEKALVDYCYFVALGKKTKNERLSWQNLNQDKIRFYQSLFRNPKLEKIMKAYA